MTDNAGWKQVGDVYRTAGTILETGSFISKSGHQVSITEEDSKDLYNSLGDEFLPISIDHNGKPIGHAVRFARVGNSIEHNGIVLDNDEFRMKVILGGYNHISPEIDYVYDSMGNVINKKLVGLSFVKNPAMNNTLADVSRFAFSAPEVNVMTDESTNTTNNVPTNQAPASAPVDIAALAAMITQGVSEKFESRLEALQSELTALKSANATPQVKTPTQEFLENGGINPKITGTSIQSDDIKDMKENYATIEGTIAPPIDKEVFEEYARTKAELESREAELAKYREQNEKVLRKQYSDITAELKNLGYADPSLMVKSLKTYEEKIDTLTAIKANHVKTTPMNSSTKAPMNAEGGGTVNTGKLTILEAAKSVGLALTPEEMEHMSKKFGAPIQ